MEISRIEAFKPSIIDWKNLTAREIVRYKSSGIDVPNLYYQWAISFLNEVENARKDDVTYQSAIADSRHSDKEISGASKSGENQNKDEAQKIENEEKIPEQAEIKYGSQEVLENPKTEGEVEKQEDQINTAREVREKMELDGYSTIQIANVFNDISTSYQELTNDSAETSQMVEENSNSEIEMLESDMENFMSQINEIKDRINNYKNKKDDVTVISKIAQLNVELKSLGINAQSQLAGYLSGFNQYDDLVSENLTIGSEAIDFGNETINIGNEIPPSLLFFGMREKTIDIGENTVSGGNDSNDAYNQAKSTNDENISNANSYEDRIFANTGVGGFSEENTNIKNDKTDPDQIDGKTKEADKGIKTAQNDGTDTTDKLHLNIDEILKRKVRRGENNTET